MDGGREELERPREGAGEALRACRGGKARGSKHAGKIGVTVVGAVESTAINMQRGATKPACIYGQGGPTWSIAIALHQC